MNSKLAQWIGLASLGIVVILLGAHAYGLSDGWVSAVSSLLTVLVSIVAILIPLQQERDKKRRAHLKVLVDEVLTPLSNELQQRHLATVSRNTFPLEWWPNIGLFVRSRGQQAAILQPPPTPLRGLQKNRYEDASSHYPVVIRQAEEFKRDYDAFLDSLLDQALEMERRLRALPGVRPIDGPDAQLGCHYGALALYVFDRLWMRDYPHPLDVRRAAGAVDRIWTLQKTSDTADVARGTEGEMRQLNEQVEQFIAATDHDAVIQSAKQMERRLEEVQDAIAEVQASEKLVGRCPVLE